MTLYRQLLQSARAVALVLVTTSLGVAVAQTDPTATFAFVHMTVIDGTGASARPNQTVVVSEDRIVAVGPHDEVPVPRNVRTFDSTGRFMIPGLWDAHVHTRFEGIDHLRLLIANGITSARNMSGPWAHLAELRRWREEIAAGVRVGPRLLTTGPIFGALGAGVGRATDVAISTADEGRDAVLRSAKEGVDFIKVYDRLNRESFAAIVAEAKRARLPVVGHVSNFMSAGDVSVAGQLTIEHLDGILRASSTREAEIFAAFEDWRPAPGTRVLPPVSPTLVVESFSVAKLRALADVLRTNETTVVPTLSNYRNRVERFDERFLEQLADRLRYIPAGYVEAWKQVQMPESVEAQQALFEQGLVTVRELHDANVTILAGTDGIMSFQLPGFSLHDELSLLVNAGLSEMEALAAATRNPARVFGLTDQGTIESGMRADLVLLDANPLEDIDNVRTIRAVVAAGRLFEREQLDAMLVDVERTARQWTGTATR